jgi:hypothetical protein
MVNGRVVSVRGCDTHKVLVVDTPPALAAVRGGAPDAAAAVPADAAPAAKPDTDEATKDVVPVAEVVEAGPTDGMPSGSSAYRIDRFLPRGGGTRGGGGGRAGHGSVVPPRGQEHQAARKNT